MKLKLQVLQRDWTVLHLTHTAGFPDKKYPALQLKQVVDKFIIAQFKHPGDAWLQAKQFLLASYKK